MITIGGLWLVASILVASILHNLLAMETTPATRHLAGRESVPARSL